MIIEVSENTKKKVDSILEKLDYFAITFDAGTTVNRNAVYCCAANPSLLQSHIYLGSKRNYSGSTAYDYKFWAKEYIDKYKKISAFVGDGLPAGIAGIADFKNGGLLAESMGTEAIFSPCHNHILSNSFLNACSEDASLKNIVQSIDDFAILINKSGMKEILINVPHIPKTRWLYVYDIILYVQKHKEDINIALKQTYSTKIFNLLKQKRFEKFKDGVPDMFFDLYESIKPLKNLQLALECDSTSLSHVYLFLIYTINELTKIETQHDKEEVKKYAACFKTALINEFKKKARLSLLVFAFALTPLGMKYIQGESIESLLTVDLRIKIKNKQNEETNNEAKNDYIGIDFEEEEDDEENSETANERTKQYPENALKYVKPFNLPDSNEAARFDKIDERKELPCDLIFNPEDIKIITCDVFNNREQLKRINEQNAINNKRIKEQIKNEVGYIAQSLYMFLTNPFKFDDIEYFCSNEVDIYGYAFWKRQFTQNSLLKSVAAHALQLMSIPAGESDCERIISMTRNIYDSHKARQKEELTENRIRAKVCRNIIKSSKSKDKKIFIME